MLFAIQNIIVVIIMKYIILECQVAMLIFGIFKLV
nr:MAG TPA_asm: hypothetical protein [Bacteriophage sp.]